MRASRILRFWRQLPQRKQQDGSWTRAIPFKEKSNAPAAAVAVDVLAADPGIRI